MPLARKFVINALLQQNFLPAQKKDKDELPPIVNSKGFSEPLAKALAALASKRDDPYRGYDAVEYKLTRFNGVSRVCSIPHPRAYAGLALSIADNWPKLKYLLANQVSKVVPEQHDDGRIIIMDYESAADEAIHKVKASFGQRYLVKTDISNFYPSIYSHSISWATVGTATAKLNVKKSNTWYNKMDSAVRWTKRNETMGIAIGPGTSNIVAEAILARVDGILSSRFTYTRYIDDYTVYCGNHEEAEKFVLALSYELNKFNLVLNAGKTAITPMPQMSRQEWVVDLRRASPRKDDLSVQKAVDYLDFVVSLSDRTPDGSVLKFGLKTLIGVALDGSATISDEVLRVVLRYALNLAFHNAALIPSLEKLLDAVQILGDPIPRKEIYALLMEHLRFRRSDAVSWLLYYVIKYRIPLTDECAHRVLETEDCIPILLLYQTRRIKHKRWVTDFAKKLDPKDLYRLDQYWMLLYELFREGKIANPYGSRRSGDRVFETMAAAKLKFVDTVLATP